MFRAKLTGHIAEKTGYDLYGQPLAAVLRPIRFSQVNLRRKSGKTTVRADSSASRGAADEITTDLACILVPPQERIQIGDIFHFDGDSYVVVSRHVRRSVAGAVDHIECNLEIRPR